MKICIGIISYFPDGDLWEIRKNSFINLCKQCRELFDLDYLVIAQNWKDFSPTVIGRYRISYYDEPLGIIGARNELRELFLASEYDYMIMLDDDCTLIGDKNAAKKYIEQIEEHPGMCGMFNGTLLKLFAISKELFKNISFGNGRVENGDYFEDILFVNTIQKKWPDKVFKFIKYCLNERSNNFNDENSTWFHGQYNKHDIGDRTRAILKEL